MPRKKVLRTIKPTPLKGTLRTKDIERAVDAVRAKRERPGPKATRSGVTVEEEPMAHAVTEARVVTADELLMMPHRGVRRELVRGEVREMAPPGEEHAESTTELVRLLGNHVRAHGLGKVYVELGFRLASDPDTVLIPDVSFVRADRIVAGPPNRGYRSGAPDLAVEVLSPNDSAEEVEEKVFLWLLAGCRMVVVANPRIRSATVYRSFKDVTVLSQDETLDGGDVVPGWTLPLRELFG
jgi:Uma2 family endonuclease